MYYSDYICSKIEEARNAASCVISSMAGKDITIPDITVKPFKGNYAKDSLEAVKDANLKRGHDIAATPSWLRTMRKNLRAEEKRRVKNGVDTCAGVFTYAPKTIYTYEPSFKNLVNGDEKKFLRVMTHEMAHSMVFCLSGVSDYWDIEEDFLLENRELVDLFSYSKEGVGEHVARRACPGCYDKLIDDVIGLLNERTDLMLKGKKIPESLKRRLRDAFSDGGEAYRAVLEKYARGTSFIDSVSKHLSDEEALKIGTSPYVNEFSRMLQDKDFHAVMNYNQKNGVLRYTKDDVLNPANFVKRYK